MVSSLESSRGLVVYGKLSLVLENCRENDSVREFLFRPGCCFINSPLCHDAEQLHHSLMGWLSLRPLHAISLGWPETLSAKEPGSTGLWIQRSYPRDFSNWPQAMLAAVRSNCQVLSCSSQLPRQHLHRAINSTEHIECLILTTCYPHYGQLLERLFREPEMLHRNPDGTLVRRGFRLVHREGARLEGLEFGDQEYQAGHYQLEQLKPQFIWDLPT